MKEIRKIRVYTNEKEVKRRKAGIRGLGLLMAFCMLFTLAFIYSSPVLAADSNPAVAGEGGEEALTKRLSLTVKIMLEENGRLLEDRGAGAGTVTADAVTVSEGDAVNLTVVEKAGYRLKEAYLSNPRTTIQNNRFTVPSGVNGSLEIIALFEAVGQNQSREYYIDSQEGNDQQDGSINAPWKTLGKLAECGSIQPGSKIYLKRGSRFDGQQLSFQGSGTSEAPILIDAYGEGAELPQLNGKGVVTNVVSLFNQEYITIQNLEITNESPSYNTDYTLNGSNNKSLTLRAINVSAKNYGTVSGITIKNCYIHNINGNINLKWNGGIFFDVQVDVADGQLVGTPTKYDKVLIEGCTFVNVDRSAIKLVSSGWCNQWEANDKTKPVNWYPSTNVVVRNNYMEKIGGDGITVRDTDGALVEYNLAKDCRFQNTGYNVAIWPFEAANTVVQYNECFDTHGTTDGQGLDCDHASSYSVMQYNYSHNNEGGFMLIMGGYPHTAPTVRYNISQNDYDKTFEFAQGIPNGTMIYNNTIYSENTTNRGVIMLSNTGAGVGVNDMYFFNNIFCYPKGQKFFYGETAKLESKAHLYNNAYLGGITAPAQETNAIQPQGALNTILVNAGSGPENKDAKTARTGKSGLLDGYKLCQGSLLIDKGVTLEKAVQEFGGTISQVYDGRNLSPREAFEKARAEGNPSLSYIMGNNFPRVAGVSYERDFFGNARVTGSAPDIGAAEYSK